MSPVQEPSATEGIPPVEAHDSELSLLRIYLLRAFYLFIVVGLGVAIWPVVISHSSDLASHSGIYYAVFAGIGAISVLGIRYPVKMLPVLLFEFLWKTIYLLFFALPLWRAGQITDAVMNDVYSTGLVVIFWPLVPWGYVIKNYLLKSGDRWR
ncbi:MAG: hypothetical protein ABR906_08240 [Terracidiphilus sp.]|jgi:hypothetical protein